MWWDVELILFQILMNFEDLQNYFFDLRSFLLIMEN